MQICVWGVCVGKQVSKTATVHIFVSTDTGEAETNREDDKKFLIRARARGRTGRQSRISKPSDKLVKLKPAVAAKPPSFPRPCLTLGGTDHRKFHLGRKHQSVANPKHWCTATLSIWSRGRQGIAQGDL